MRGRLCHIRYPCSQVRSELTQLTRAPTARPTHPLSNRPSSRQPTSRSTTPSHLSPNGATRQRARWTRTEAGAEG